MSYPGEYTGPLTRKHFVNVPVISGYVTSRLRAQDSPVPTISGDDTSLRLLLENTGNTQFGLLVQATDDRISGPRTTLLTIGSIVPGGRTTQSTSTKQLYLEIKGTGNGSLRMQIESQRQWAELGFAKDDPFYPTALFTAKPTLAP